MNYLASKMRIHTFNWPLPNKIKLVKVNGILPAHKIPQQRKNAKKRKRGKEKKHAEKANNVEKTRAKNGETRARKMENFSTRIGTQKSEKRRKKAQKTRQLIN